MRGGVIPEKALGGCCGLCLCVRAAVSRGERDCGFVEVLPLRPLHMMPRPFGLRLIDARIVKSRSLSKLGPVARLPLSDRLPL